ncbi:MAG: polyphosphate polymerase domain-containing protein [Verrucomicrobiae bacterium]|nr:polyphosphate polymerase domain-containing protein [Verrucomicrobiae bacterium]
MAVDRMQQQRFELKYLITEDKALMVRDFVRSAGMELDEYSAIRPNFSYPVHSLYLDNDALTTYWETINGNKNRFKLRLRYYSTDPDTPVFFEIKRRMNNCILKQRGGVRQQAVEALLSGHLPEPQHLVNYSAKALVALQRFCELAQRLQAKPKVHIAYLREAYVNDNDTVRVTMDRQVCGEPNLRYAITTEMERPRYSYRPYVILELKFTNRFPNWFKELVRVFNVMQRGAAKYVSSIQAIGDPRLLEAHTTIVQEEEVNYD